ncbi:hypothetical protein DDQ68_19660 [Hymenobacter nivis]|uniref:General stress protein FMN-binding split barrel domain-containing protein n=1 Tax=Hymenobacter nivis TaxID=1850093 RepID=A0A2Z3GNH7_9BACT|nr:hypothetical protein DDQ68_19660 [Hymenobacter nivis]
MWREYFRGFFPKDTEDPNITLIKVTIENGEYWDTPGNGLVRAFAYPRPSRPAKSTSLSSKSNPRCSLTRAPSVLLNVRAPRPRLFDGARRGYLPRLRR